VEQPVLQCVQIKTMEPKAGDANPVQRFRVVLSDIRNFIQTMIATSMWRAVGSGYGLINTAANEIVTSGQLKKGSIVRLLKFNPQQVKDKKYVSQHV
jgi:replication factor A1